MFDQTIFQNTYVSGIIGSFLASFLTLGTIELFSHYRQRIRNSKFKAVFGFYDKDKLNLVLPELRLRQEVIQYLQESDINDAHFPLIKTGSGHVRTSRLLAYNDMTSLKYVLDIISSTLGYKSVIKTDEQLSNSLDISFISFGGTNFYCSLILNQPDNNFYFIRDSEIISKKDPAKRFKIDNEFDYGFIIKYKHKNFPERTWIIIAGIGESGTSGAGWYLSAYWKEISDTFKDNAFGVLVKVKHGVDESAIKVDQIE